MSMSLSNHFYLCLSALSSDVTPDNAKSLWRAIFIHYGKPKRAYHTLRHIEQLLAQFDNIKHHLTAPNIVALTLYYHDVIYEPERSDNEQKSAEYAVAALSPYLNTEQCQDIYALIMMTADHQLNTLADSNKNNDAAYVLDMDLSILGASWSAYQQYAQTVRQEYAHVSDTNYRDGRTAVLKGLLAHPKLYLTDYYRERLENQARDNINREIILLAS